MRMQEKREEAAAHAADQRREKKNNKRKDVQEHTPRETGRERNRTRQIHTTHRSVDRERETEGTKEYEEQVRGLTNGSVSACCRDVSSIHRETNSIQLPLQSLPAATTALAAFNPQPAVVGSLAHSSGMFSSCVGSIHLQRLVVFLPMLQLE